MKNKVLKYLICILLLLCLNVTASDLQMQSPWQTSGNSVYLGVPTNKFVGINDAAPTSYITVTGNPVIANLLQAYWSEATTTFNTFTGMIAYKNTNTTDGNFEGFAFQTNDSTPANSTVAKIGVVNTSHAAGAVSGDFIVGLRHVGSLGQRFVIKSNGDIGANVTSPTAALHLRAGTATASTAPLKFTAGTNLTTPEAGVVEYDGTELYVTDSVPTRNTLAKVLSATSASIGGGALIAGACANTTTAVTGAATTMAVITTPTTYPGDGFFWHGYVSSANNVTVSVCASIAGTPTASTYIIRIIK